MKPISCILIRGGGDLATGTAVRLHRAGFQTMLTELAQPLAVRRGVSFSEAVYEEEWTVEGVVARRADGVEQALQIAREGCVPVVVAPELELLRRWPFPVVVDARVTKQPAETDLSMAPLVIGLGPGFVAGIHCHAVVETQRGHTLGRVYWSGPALPDTAIPLGGPERVLRAPADGQISAHAAIGDPVKAGQAVADVGEVPVISALSGILRGLIRPGLAVSRGLKIGDVDPRGIREYCFRISEKALAVGGGVLEAVLSRKELRHLIWSA